MNKILIAIGVISIFVLVMYGLEPIKLGDHLIIEESLLASEYIEANGMSDLNLVTKEKQVIYDYQLTLASKSVPIDYVIDSVNPYVFSRDWFLEQSIIRNKSSNIGFDAILFVDADLDYHVFIRYHLTHSARGNHYFELNASTTYQLEFHTQWSTLLYNEHEYVIGGSNMLRYTNANTYKINQFYLNQYFKNPDTTGFHHFKLLPLSGFTNEFINLELTLYQALPNANIPTQTLGFNGFRLNPTQTRYIPQTIELLYIKENA